MLQVLTAQGGRNMDVIWESMKLIGMVLFGLLVMFMTWSHMQGGGKGWDDNTPGAMIGWPKSRLLNFIAFHLFFLGILVMIHNFFIGGFEVTSTLQQIEGYEGAGLAIIFIIVGATNLLGAKFLLGEVRKGWLQKFDKIAPLLVRIFGAFLILAGLVELVQSFG